ncbi:MAG TPA: type III glutamate--ammonia ligase [Chloroflexota bacterium]|nr:type III glutamate--ammonia ligase [Chloroflexota bacterium]
MAVIDAPTQTTVNPAELKRQLEQQGVRFLLSSFVELAGVPKAKLVPITHLEDVARDGAGFAGFAAGYMGQGPNSPDIAAIPDLASLMILPWRREVAWAASDVYVEGEQWPYCPRLILKRQIARARAMGFTFKTGIEPEFFLVRKDEHGRLVLADAKDDLAKPCYDQRTLTRSLDFLTTLVTYMQELGWDPYANDHEDANGQFEIDWAYSDCLTTADRYIFLRYMVKVLAEQHGWIATFMPKPFANLTGNGAHFHMSLWDATKDTPLFEDPGDSYGLSRLAYHFIGGLKAHARAVAAVTSPTVNSYKRLIMGNARSGATWAPVYVSYGGNNRTQMLRIPAPGRVENRTIDGACNPYLAATVLLAAGLDGIEKELDAGAPNERNMYEMSPEELRRKRITILPSTLKEAVDALEADKVIQAALGEEYARTYISAKRDEWEEYHNSISQWEIDRYVELF